MLRSIIELAISAAILIGGGKVALVKAHDYMHDLAFSKISKGLSSTQKLNDQLWGR